MHSIFMYKCVHCLVVLHAARIDFLRPLTSSKQQCATYLLNSFALFSWLVVECVALQHFVQRKRIHSYTSLDLLWLAKRTIINDAIQYNTTQRCEWMSSIFQRDFVFRPFSFCDYNGAFLLLRTSRRAV